MRTIKEWVKELLNHLLLFFYKPKYNSKVFCIGYNKTGTTTIGKSLELLGLRNTSFNKKVWRKWYTNGNIEKILKYTAKFDSTDDLPWLKEDMIPILDKTFPKSKFIYLIREESAWKNSFRNWNYKKTGKYPNIEEGYKNYLKHQKFVYEYFKNRKNDLLIIDVNESDAFIKVGKFIKKKAPQTKLPVYNSTKLFRSKYKIKQ